MVRPLLSRETAWKTQIRRSEAAFNVIIFFTGNWKECQRVNYGRGTRKEKSRKKKSKEKGTVVWKTLVARDCGSAICCSTHLEWENGEIGLCFVHHFGLAIFILCSVEKKRKKESGKTEGRSTKKGLSVSLTHKSFERQEDQKNTTYLHPEPSSLQEDDSHAKQNGTAESKKKKSEKK